MARASGKFRPELLARKVFVWTVVYALAFAAAAVSIMLHR